MRVDSTSNFEEPLLPPSSHSSGSSRSSSTDSPKKSSRWACLRSISTRRFFSPKAKRRLLYINTGVYVFLNSIEYAVIIPSLWLYLDNDYKATTSFMGLCLAAFSISSLIFCPIFGFINDRTRDTKTLVIICNSFEILGNALYLVRSQWVVFVARIVAGVGTAGRKPGILWLGGACAISGAIASAPLMFADVNRATPTRTRTAVISFIIMFRQIGFLVGPALNLVLSKIEFDLFSLRVDQFTSPGFSMTILWVLHQIQILFTFFNVDEYCEALESEGNDVEMVENEDAPFLTPVRGDGDENQDDGEGDEGVAVKIGRPPTWTDYWNEFSRDEVVVLIYLALLLFYGYSSIEAIVTPFALTRLSWGQIETSALFAGAAGGVLVVSVVVAVASRWVSDRGATLVNLFLVAASLAWALGTLPGTRSCGSWLKFNFVGSITSVIVSHAVAGITAYSLYTKCLEDSMQGFGTGLRRSITNVGLILGPLWSGSMIDRLDALLAVNLSLVLFVTVLFLCSWQRMKPKKNESGISSK